MKGNIPRAVSELASAIVWACVAVSMTMVPTLVRLQAQTATPLIEARFVQTRVSKAHLDSPVVIQEGTYFLAQDGRYRIERRNERASTAEIVDFRQRRRAVLDLIGKTAIVGSMSVLPPGTDTVPAVPMVVQPSAPSPRSERRETLGPRMISGGLVLEGYRFTVLRDGAQVDTFEVWEYRFPEHGLLPVLMEERFEDGREIMERRVTAVMTVPMSEELFSVPVDFAVVKRHPRP
jgi:hypothetical protein